MNTLNYLPSILRRRNGIYTYKGQYYSLGVYTNIEDSIKVRVGGKALYQSDALELQDFYEEIHKKDFSLPNRATEPQREFSTGVWKINDQPGSAAKRIDNRSGQTGVTFTRGRWKVHIRHKCSRYILSTLMPRGALWRPENKQSRILQQTRMDLLNGISKNTRIMSNKLPDSNSPKASHNPLEETATYHTEGRSFVV